MADEVGGLHAEMVEQRRQGGGQPGERHRVDGRRAPVARHVPRHRAVGGGKVIELKPEGVGIAADPVHEDQPGPALGIGAGFIVGQG